MYGKKPKEKRTDVNIASHMVVDAYENNYDTALLISRDSDLVPPIELIKQNLQNKIVGVAFPPGSFVSSLSNAADYHFSISKKTFKQNQLPNEIEKQNGYKLKRPLEWK